MVNGSAVDTRTKSTQFKELSHDRLGFPHEDVEEFDEFASQLRRTVSGEVRFDEYHQVLYATDGSIYQARPAGVVIPRDEEDVVEAVSLAARHGIPVLPRGTGSSLAGQAVGPGCLVIDTSKYMDSILEIRPDEKRVRVQPGVVQDDLDEALAPHGLKFAPDPASSNRATLGGGIGNNSTGAHSVRYGITDAYTEKLEVILSDGSRITTREVVLDGEEWDRIVRKNDREAKIYRTVRGLVEENREEIERRYPKIKRNVSGYNLNKTIYENEQGERVINLSKLMVGAEGTLGVVVEATLSLVTLPEDTALALYCYDDLIEAMVDVPRMLEQDPSAVELMDEEVFRLARESGQYARYAEMIPDGCSATLMVEFDNEVHDDLEAAVQRTNERFVKEGNAFEVIEAFRDDKQERIWKLRKAAIPLLMGLKGDAKPYPFIEDATVPPENLAEYVQGFADILEQHGTRASYFAHVGSGTLHIRPILNLKDDEGIQKMHSIAEDVTTLVQKYHGSFSGEHGDGLSRTEFNPKMYGPELWEAFQELKTAFDPEWLMNPGKVVYREEVTDTRDNLRYGADYSTVEPTTKLDFESEGGFGGLVELCNGCGTCRQTGNDTMCPTYRASREEIQTTRGRANMLRAAISGEIPEQEMYSERFQKEVLDLCVGCKGCKSDCPTGVDMAKLKAEVKHQYHRREGASLRGKMFANIEVLSALGSATAPFSNWVNQLPVIRHLMENTLGISSRRDLPEFHNQTLLKWFNQRGQCALSESEAEAKVLLYPDTFTNYTYPRAGQAAIRVLEAAGVHVRIPHDTPGSGRPAYSTGFLDVAEEKARQNVSDLHPYVEDDWDVVFLEPSDSVMFQDEYRQILEGEKVEAVASSTYEVMEYLNEAVSPGRVEFEANGERLTYHGHCNQKALNRGHHAAEFLRQVGYEVDYLDSGCCGMAGSFGYEAEHYELSNAIGDILRDQIDQSDGDAVVAPGTSCRSQLKDLFSINAHHPVEKVEQALTSSL